METQIPKIHTYEYTFTLFQHEKDHPSHPHTPSRAPDGHSRCALFEPFSAISSLRHHHL